MVGTGKPLPGATAQQAEPYPVTHVLAGSPGPPGSRGPGGDRGGPGARPDAAAAERGGLQGNELGAGIQEVERGPAAPAIPGRWPGRASSVTPQDHHGRAGTAPPLTLQPARGPARPRLPPHPYASRRIPPPHPLLPPSVRCRFSAPAASPGAAGGRIHRRDRLVQFFWRVKVDAGCFARPGLARPPVGGGASS